ncbi:MAG: hypothetical protein KGM99_10285, partial [Burkholderiales bacterium]|nr:hypothetical protein [Burkholderiales bacterium]
KFASTSEKADTSSLKAGIWQRHCLPRIRAFNILPMFFKNIPLIRSKINGLENILTGVYGFHKICNPFNGTRK